jgi:hypothetical protein
MHKTAPPGKRRFASPAEGSPSEACENQSPLIVV